MKREIKFRGKIASYNLEELISCELEFAHKDGWVEGSFVEPNIITGRVADIDWDYFATEWWANVIPETVSQFTGLKDKNGIEIYEGDILKIDEGHPVEVRYEKIYASFGIWRKGWAFLHYFHEAVEPKDCEVIGNIHDNPELIANLE